MTRTDTLWLVFVAICLSVGVLGGSYLKKDELLPICHSLAPGLFPPIVVALQANDGVFDSSLMHAGEPWQLSLVGPDCQANCQQHLELAFGRAEDRDLLHLVISQEALTVEREPSMNGVKWVIGANVATEQVARDLGLTSDQWNQPGYVATWALNRDHHIERRWVKQLTAFDN